MQPGGALRLGLCGGEHAGHGAWAATHKPTPSTEDTPRVSQDGAREKKSAQPRSRKSNLTCRAVVYWAGRLSPWEERGRGAVAHVHEDYAYELSCGPSVAPIRRPNMREPAICTTIVKIFSLLVCGTMSPKPTYTE